MSGIYRNSARFAWPVGVGSWDWRSNLRRGRSHRFAGCTDHNPRRGSCQIDDETMAVARVGRQQKTTLDSHRSGDVEYQARSRRGESAKAITEYQPSLGPTARIDARRHGLHINDDTGRFRQCEGTKRRRTAKVEDDPRLLRLFAESYPEKIEFGGCAIELSGRGTKPDQQKSKRPRYQELVFLPHLRKRYSVICILKTNMRRKRTLTARERCRRASCAGKMLRSRRPRIGSPRADAVNGLPRQYRSAGFYLSLSPRPIAAAEHDENFEILHRWQDAADWTPWFVHLRFDAGWIEHLVRPAGSRVNPNPSGVSRELRKAPCDNWSYHP